MSVKEYLFQKASINRIPLSGTFELSPVCNFECKMCYVRKTRNQLQIEGKKEYSTEDWLRLAEQCKKSGMLYLLLTGGEPFIYPGFKELYENLHKMGFILSINSNASMIDEKTIEWLKEFAPSRINITLYGASEETYQRICGNGSAFKRVVKAIRLLKEAGISVVLNASMIPENAEDMKSIIQFGKDNDIPVRMGTYMFPPVRREKEETDSRFSPQQAGEMSVLKQYYLRQPKEFEEYGTRMLNCIEGKEGKVENSWGQYGDIMTCRAGKSTFWISWEGKMTACGIMDFPIAVYPFEEEFFECWKKLTKEVRSKSVLKGCNGCPKKEVCSPCAAIIHAETGDVNEKATYLCEMADATIECWKRMRGRGEETNES